MTSNETQTFPARLELDALVRYEMSKLGLWRAICKRSPQLALFEEVYGDSPDSGAEWVSYSTSDTLGEPVRLLERRLLTLGAGRVSIDVLAEVATPAPSVSSHAHKWCRTVLGRMGLTANQPGLAPSSPPPPVDEDGSAPSTTCPECGHVHQADDGWCDAPVCSEGCCHCPCYFGVDVDRPCPHDQEVLGGRGQKEQQ